jgi:predicted tellurium resistance membrane protein TerC
MEWLQDPHVWTSFVTLAVLEIVLGIDNARALQDGVRGLKVMNR